LHRVTGIPSPSPRLTMWLAAVLLVGCIGFALFLNRVQPSRHGGTVLNATSHVLALESRTDSWEPMANALQVWRGPDHADIYKTVFFAPVEKFQYPPAALFLAMGLEKGPDLAGIPFETWTMVASLIALAAATSFILDRMLGQRGFEAASPVERTLRLLLIIGLLLTFYPVVHGFEIGQAQLWIDAFFALALAAWVGERKRLSGVLIGMACLIKPQLAVLVIWGLLRREWRFAAALAGFGVIAAIISLAWFGLENHFGYLRALSYLSQHGGSLYANQSVNGLLGRLVSLGDPEHYNNLIWMEGLPPYHPLIYFGTLISSIVILLPALFVGSNADRTGRSLDFCTVALSATMASPVAWDHHYGVIFPIYAVALAAGWGRPLMLLALGASYVVASHYIPGTGVFAYSLLNIVQSYLFFAAILLLAVLYLLRLNPERLPARS
jgi:alpha-1,2-mannosyltransferase